MLNGRDISANIAGVPVLCDQPESNLFSSTSNEQGNMWFLYPFGLVYCPFDLVVGSFKGSFILRPHGQDDLDRLTKTA